ncbi:MAG: trypsin-like peptidase domain-containing protein [Nocardioides sp.]
MPTNHSSADRTRRFAGMLLAGVLALAPMSAYAADESEDPAEPSGTSDSTVLAANALPGVQLIATKYSARIITTIPKLSDAAIAALQARIVRQLQSGGLDLTEEAVIDAIVEAVVKSPNTYFVPGGTDSKRQSLTGLGTGWVVTPDGYMITAAHVVDTPVDELRVAFASNFLNKVAKDFARGLQSGGGAAFTPEQVDKLTNSVLGWMSARLAVQDLDVSVEANLALGFDGLGKEQKAVDAEIVEVGKPYPGNDVALLKIDGQKHLPTIPIGDDGDVDPGATVHVVGFPAASTFLRSFSRDSQAQPTVTEGPVTAIKSTNSGMPVLQTQAPASPGNSGGPVLTDDGKAVGVLVASAVDQNGVAAQGQQFVIPASEVKDMLKENGVEAEQSDTTKVYTKAVRSFYADRYKEAIPLFEKAETLYPAHPFAKQFITDSNLAIDEGRDKTPKKEKSGGLGTTLLWVALGGLVLLALAGGGAAIFLARRKKAAPAGLPMPLGGFNQGGYPQGAPQQGGYPQPGNYPPGGYQQPGGQQQQGYPQGAPQQGGYPQPGNYPPGTYPQGAGQPQGGYPQSDGQPQGGYPQGVPQQGGYPQPGNYPPGTYPQGAGQAQGGYPQGAPQQANGPAGYPPVQGDPAPQPQGYPGPTGEQHPESPTQQYQQEYTTDTADVSGDFGAGQETDSDTDQAAQTDQWNAPDDEWRSDGSKGPETPR